MFHSMRKKERELPEEETLSLLEKGEYGVLATVGADGMPYGVPMSYALEGNTIYLHGVANTGHRWENLQLNPNVCFTVVGETCVLPEKFSTAYASAIVFGTVSLADDPVVGLMALAKKYSPDYLEKGKAYASGSVLKGEVAVYALHIQRITGKARRMPKDK